jgi:hypothetical protein
LASFAPLREMALIRFLILIAPRRQERKEQYLWLGFSPPGLGFT